MFRNAARIVLSCSAAMILFGATLVADAAEPASVQTLTWNPDEQAVTRPVQWYSSYYGPSYSFSYRIGSPYYYSYWGSPSFYTYGYRPGYYYSFPGGYTYSPPSYYVAPSYGTYYRPYYGGWYGYYRW